ncbi:DUF218 domain-containing protein [Rhypophila decipiens]|uniref:DUF218 domain-containing protein n=1 Tax=Rhypophila decipiens TaxID=261697 RepID=A0AAN6Y9H9_9PEZI|nr:DUF218 domain-containing protein [Rhypophila decipiens]
MGDQSNQVAVASQPTTAEERPHQPLTVTDLNMTPLPAVPTTSTNNDKGTGPTISSYSSDSINTNASTVYNYHRMNLPLFPPSSNIIASTATPSISNASNNTIQETTAIFTLCSLDIRIAHHAASLFLSGLSSPPSTKSSGGPPEIPLGAYQYSHLIFSGKVGALTANHHQFSDGRAEATVFADIASSAPYHIPPDKILIEPSATNTGENVRFTYALLNEAGLLDGSGPEKVKITKFVLVQKPYMERRTFATFVKQWPGGQKTQTERGGSEEAEADGNVEFTVTSPPLAWQDYPDADNPRDLVISIMVGDLVRIKEYPAKGYQIEQHIPDQVWEAGQRLIRAGYGRHLP